MTAIRISDLAERSRIRPATLRYYESLGLLRPERDPNGYRRYRAEDLDRLRFVTRAKQLGLRLDEIAELLLVRGDGACPPVRERYVGLLAGRLAETRHSIAELSSLESELAQLHGRLRASAPPARCGEGCGCPDHPLIIGPAPPVACTLPTDQATDRADEWREMVAVATLTTETADGWRLQFPADPPLVARLAGLVAAEQRCCEVFAFRLEFTAEAVDLYVGVAPGARAPAAVLFGAADGPRSATE